MKARWPKRLRDILWLWIFRTALVLFLWTAIDVIFSGLKLAGYDDVGFLGISYKAGFLALADPNFLWNSIVGTIVVIVVFIVAYRKLVKGGASKLGIITVLMLFDDLSSGLLVFAVITFIHLYLHVLPYAIGHVSFSTPIWMWLAAMVIYFLVRWFEPGHERHKKCSCDCNCQKNADDRVPVNEPHNGNLAG